MEKMRATVFHGVNDIHVEEVERPHAGVGEAVIRVTLTTICGTDLHIAGRISGQTRAHYRSRAGGANRRTRPCGRGQAPHDAFAAGLGDYRIVTTLCSGGKARMRRLMEVVRHGRVDLGLC